MVIDEHKKWLISEILRARDRAVQANIVAKKTGDGKALAQAWISCGCVGALVASWNHLTGEQRIADDLSWI